MELQRGTFLRSGKYRIESALGQGGFGITYLATDVNLDKYVCIKEFFMQHCCSRDDDSTNVAVGGNADMYLRFKNKFLKEARTTAGLRHSNIVTIFDVFEENNTVYYVMDFIQGCSLQVYVVENGALTESQARSFVSEVASALKYLHSQHLTHLDVKPGNIMIRERDKHIFLIDFGLTKRYDDEGEQTSSTPVGISAGYAPLEQYDGVKTFSPETDIYALGATLYFLLLGKRPPSPSDVPSDGLTGLPYSISYPMRNAIVKSMKPNRKDRPHTIDEFTRLLTVVSSPKPIHLSGGNQPTPSQKTVKEPKRKVVAKPKRESYSFWLIAFLVGVVGLCPFYPLMLYPFFPSNHGFSGHFVAVVITTIVLLGLSVTSLVGFANREDYAIRPAFASISVSLFVSMLSLVLNTLPWYIEFCAFLVTMSCIPLSYIYLSESEEINRHIPESSLNIETKHYIIYSFILVLLILAFVFF